MTTQPTNRPTALRRALLLDAAVSGTMGVLLLVAAGPAAPTLGLPASLLRWVGVILLPFAARLAWIATRPSASRGDVRVIIGANVLWVVASVLLLLSGSLSPTLLGELFVLLQAAVVAGFAYAEYAGLRRAGAPPSMTTTAAPYGERHG